SSRVAVTGCRPACSVRIVSMSACVRWKIAYRGTAAMVTASAPMMANLCGSFSCLRNLICSFTGVLQRALVERFRRLARRQTCQKTNVIEFEPDTIAGDDRLRGIGRQAR